MKKSRFSMVCMAVLLCVMTLASCTAQTAKQKFIVGMECNYTPFNWTQADNKNGAVAIATGGFAAGYDIEIAKKVADGLGRELVVQKIEWDGLIPALTSGKIDAIIAGMSPTAERKLTVDFTDPYYESDLVIVVRKDGRFASATQLSDFTGAKITAQQNTFHYTVIDQIPGVSKQNAMADFPAMIVALSSKKIDGYISERPGAVSACAANADLTFVSFAAGKGFVASPEDVAVSVALKKGSKDVAAINTILAKITKEQRQQIMDTAIKNQPVTQ
jgi:ABC-type amino acid transport substrate-binding protein